jgi:hypothetical protein
MGVGFSHLFAASGGTSIVDYQIRNFQVGSGGDFNDYGASTFKLQAPITETDLSGGELFIENLTPIQNGVVVAAEDFPRIRFSNIHRVTDASVRYTLVLDRGSAQGVALDEVGRGLVSPSPILVAYRPHTEIVKNNTFSLIYRWTLTFG